MSKKEKLLKRLLSRPSDFTYQEAVTLLRNYGYTEKNKGKTSGSRIIFMRNKDRATVMLHKPHPNHVLKEYVLELIVTKLKQNGDI